MACIFVYLLDNQKNGEEEFPENSEICAGKFQENSINLKKTQKIVRKSHEVQKTA